MTNRNWIARLWNQRNNSRLRKQGQRQNQRFRPSLEALEQRFLLSGNTYTVNTLTDNSGSGTGP